MQVCAVNFNNNKTQNSSKIGKRPSFGGFLCHDNIAHCTLDSSFFRENKALLTVIKHLEKKFPQGAEVLDYACSCGEEALSILALLKDKAKYKIKAFDISPIAIAHAKSGVHSVFSGFFDSFLIEKYSSFHGNQLKEAFLSVMEPIPAPKISINNSKAYDKLKITTRPFEEKYFKVQDKYLNSIKYSKGDIRTVNMIQSEKPVGAIFFRNAFYHICNNRIIEHLRGDYFRELEIDTAKMAKSVVDKVYQKLDKGGLFVLGEHFKDNIFLAGKNTPRSRTIPFKDCKFHLRGFPAGEEVLFYRKSPLVEALDEGERFSPIYYSDVFFGKHTLSCPTVWQKVK